jgi:sugar/nucleoside kinase (ribokinase family)
MITDVAFGIILDDIATWRGELHMGVLGGGGPQTAWGMAAALGGGERVGLAAGIGHDLDDGQLAPLRNAQINLDGLRTTDQPTPRAWQLIEANGQRTQAWRVPHAALATQLARRIDLLPPSYRQARGFHWGIHPEQPDLDLAHALNYDSSRISLEAFRAPDHPLAQDTLRRLMQSCAIFSANEAETLAITGQALLSEAVRAFAEAGCRVLAIRRGTAGSDVWDFAHGVSVHVTALPTEVVDVTGAGNAYCGALLATLDQGVQEASCHAAAAAAYMVEQVGLPPRLPEQRAYARRFDMAWRSSTRQSD